MWILTINSTTEGRKKATSKKVGRAETWFREEMNYDCCGGEGAVVTQKGETEQITKGNAQREHFPQAIGLENERYWISRVLATSGS